MVKAGDVLKAALAERKKVEESLGRAREEVELKVHERTNELTKAREELKAETAERHRLEQSLAKTRDELEAALKQRAGELDRLNHELNQREVRLAKTGEELTAENGGARTVRTRAGLRTSTAAGLRR